MHPSTVPSLSERLDLFSTEAPPNRLGAVDPSRWYSEAARGRYVLLRVVEIQYFGRVHRHAFENPFEYDVIRLAAAHFEG